MKADLGILLLLVGFTLGYLVLAGKFPSATPIVSSGASTGAPTNAPAGSGSVSVGTTNAARGVGDPLGLPTMAALHDLTPSQGGMQ